jgi:hypothetical protein
MKGTPEGMRPFGRPRRRRKVNIETDLQVGCGGMDWIELLKTETGGGHL